MGLVAEFDLIDDFGFTPQTPVFSFVPDYSTGNEVFVETFLNIAHTLVPVDTGYLYSTITAHNNDTYFSVETLCEYAEFVEYGTWKQMAQPYFEPALEEALDAAFPYWLEAEEIAWAEERAMKQAMAEDEAETDEEMDLAEGGGLGGVSFSSVSSFFVSVAALAVLAVVLFGIGLFFNMGNVPEEKGRRSRHRGDYDDDDESSAGFFRMPDVLII